MVHLGGQSAPRHRSVAYILQVLFPLNEQVIKEEGTFVIGYFALKTNELILNILCLRFRASLIYINNCPTRCNTKQSIYYSASSLYMFWVSTTPIIRSTQNCNYSLRYCAATSLQHGSSNEVAVQQI